MNPTKKQKPRKHDHRTRKRKKERILVIPSSTSLEIRKISNRIANDFPLHNRNISSYAPSINDDLVALKSIPREPLLDCNIGSAFRLQEPLQIGIPGLIYGKYCHDFNSTEAKKFLLKNLSANKHVDPKVVVPPIQSQGNCWFNAMFVTFFVSDKGRKFFHFLRQLMIEGRQSNGLLIPEKIRNAFALLNFGIDACLTGNKFAYDFDTNSIIHQLFDSIPRAYRSKNIVDVRQAGNPILYYMSMINYLNNNSIHLMLIRYSKSNWKDRVIQNIRSARHLPHAIVLEVFDDDAGEFDKKPTSFKIDDTTYRIDSAIVRDTSKQHFCATVTCEGKEMAYDGMSFHRLVPLEWKERMNSNLNWQFAGTKAGLVWNFTKCYQMLVYYRSS